MNRSSKLRYKIGEWVRGYVKIYPAFLQANHLSTMALIESHSRTDRYQEEKRLLKYGAKSYSQSDEDGIIAEIFRRVGTTNRQFIELGVGNGLENNTLLLSLQGWTGLWVEGSKKNVDAIHGKFHGIISKDLLRIKHMFVTKDNINEAVRDLSWSEEPDFFSLDLDGNDFYILDAINCIRPRVVSLEYNAKFLPHVDWVMAYNESHIWDGSDYFGASLKSLTNIMQKKGYSLVGCNITGCNAFYVRDDLVGENFCAPFTAENHYEPARYWAIPGFVSGQPANYGPFATSSAILGE